MQRAEETPVEAASEGPARGPRVVEGMGAVMEGAVMVVVVMAAVTVAEMGAVTEVVAAVVTVEAKVGGVTGAVERGEERGAYNYLA